MQKRGHEHNSATFVNRTFQISQGPIQPFVSSKDSSEQLHLPFLLMAWSIIVTLFTRQGSEGETQKFKVH